MIYEPHDSDVSLPALLVDILTHVAQDRPFGRQFFFACSWRSVRPDLTPRTHAFAQDDSIKVCGDSNIHHASEYKP
jgi:hypothetical protein